MVSLPLKVQRQQHITFDLRTTNLNLLVMMAQAFLKKSVVSKWNQALRAKVICYTIKKFITTEHCEFREKPRCDAYFEVHFEISFTGRCNTIQI